MTPFAQRGALLLDLQPAVKAMRSGRTGVFWMRPRAPQPHSPWQLFQKAAERQGQDAGRLYRDIKVSDAELETAVL